MSEILIPIGIVLYLAIGIATVCIEHEKREKRDDSNNTEYCNILLIVWPVVWLTFLVYPPLKWLADKLDAF